MSEVYVHYSTLEDSINKSKKVRSEISGYIDEIKRKITTPISNLNGYDSSGYASTASSLAWKKINELTDKASRLVSFEDSVRTFTSLAKNKDKYVSSQIETVASMYVKERTWYQKAGDWLYNTFCVDIPNKFDWTRGFFDCAKRVFGDIGDGLEKIHDWFKYGDGKYVLKIVTSVVASIAAVAGTIAAIVAIPFSGGATIPIVIGCIGAAATAIGSVITIVNSVSTIKGNAKALSLSGDLFDADDGNPGAARYYGNISKLSDEWNKTDMGNASQNEFYRNAGNTIDTVKVVADTTAFVCNIASLGNVKDYRYKNPNEHVTGYSFTWKNITKNIKADMGFNVSKPGLATKGKTTGDIIKSQSGFDSFFATKYAKKFKIGDSYVLPEGVIKVFKGAKIFKNITDTYDNITELDAAFKESNWGFTDWESFAKRFQNVTGILQFPKMTSPIDSTLGKLVKNIEGIRKWGKTELEFYGISF